MAKEKKEKKEKKPKEAKLSMNDLGGKMDQVVAGLNTVGGALAKLVDLQTGAVSSSKSVEPEVKKEPHVQKIEDETYPSEYIPPKFRKIVDEILSPEFGISIHDFDDRTDFWFQITVPDKYSSVIQSDREKGVQDLRGKMIPRALGENGVREWCQLIRKNLSRFYQSEGVRSPFTTVA